MDRENSLFDAFKIGDEILVGGSVLGFTGIYEVSGTSGISRGSGDGKGRIFEEIVEFADISDRNNTITIRKRYS